MSIDTEAAYRAVQSRDARFDGTFYTGVRTTGIYCRPSCSARTPHRRNVDFYASAAAAQRAGFRACKLCRPDATPGSPDWNIRADLAGRAVRLIADGVIDREGVPGLARQLGYSERQITRALVSEMGAPPLALARAQRAQTARILLENTELPASDIAFAAGFASIRQFNDTIREVYASTPTQLRQRPDGHAQRARERSNCGWPTGSRWSSLGPCTTWPNAPSPGSRITTARRYRRVLRLPHGAGAGLDHAGARLSAHHAPARPITAIWPLRWPGSVGCSIWTPTRRRWTRCCRASRRWRRWSERTPGCAPPARSTGSRWRCGPSSASRSRWPALAPCWAESSTSTARNAFEGSDWRLFPTRGGAGRGGSRVTADAGGARPNHHRGRAGHGRR